jgi:beta-glucanase (GH16 family)
VSTIRQLGNVGVVVAMAIIVLASATLAQERPTGPDQEWIQLFNGKDLTGWETYDIEHGFNNDRERIYSVVNEDGEPAIRISGKILGGLVTRESFGNYRLRLQYKWGRVKWPPRENQPFDSGLLYHSSSLAQSPMRLGSYEQAGHWPWLQSVEFGFLEGGDGGKGSETGDLYSVQFTMADVESEPLPEEQWRYESILKRKYQPGGESVTVQGNGGILNSRPSEKPVGEWNDIELIVLRQTALHVVNGKVNMAATGLRKEADGEVVPLTSGTIQFQSEAAEVFYRRLQLKPIRAVPPEYLAQIQSAQPNTLTAAERAEGWRLLFDGKTTNGWRGFRMPEMPRDWQVRDGALVCGFAGTEQVAGSRQPESHIDIVTTESYGDFELQFEWKTAPGGNSGVFFRVNENAPAVYELASEFEIRDNAAWTDSPYTAGANYGLHVPLRDVTKPLGQWNHSSILVEGDHVEHWMNGIQIVGYEIGSDDWQERLKRSGFDKNPAFAKSRSGPIALQNYGHDVAFRNIKIRPIALKSTEAPAWKLVWSDDFDTFDEQKWQRSDRIQQPNNSQQAYAPDQVRVVDGKLVILSENEPLGGLKYRSGQVISRHAQRLGRWEVRAKVPATRGMWSTVSLVPAPSAPSKYAIDIMDIRGHRPTVTASACHWGPRAPGSSNEIVLEHQASSAGKLVSYSDDFHTYAVEWLDDQLRFFVDDVYHGVLYSDEVGDFFSQQTGPMALAIGTAVGGDSVPAPDDTTAWPQRLLIDWVRVYEPLQEPAPRTFANGSFEANGGTLADWHVFGSQVNGDPNVLVHREAVKDGRSSLKLFGPASSGESYSGVSQGISVRGGERVRARLSSLVRSADSIANTRNRATMKIEFYKRFGDFFGGPAMLGFDERVIADASTPNDVWREHELLAEVPEGAVEARLSIVFAQQFDEPGAVHVDGVQFAPIAD